MGKAISLIMDCDKMVGSEFEKGLASMKTVVETDSPQSTPSTAEEKTEE